LQNGEIVRLPPPKQPHARLQVKIFKALHQRAERDGELKMEFAFQCSAHDVREADIGWTSHERWNAANGPGYFQGAPDLVIEIMSPSNSKSEMRERESYCLENGCSEFWTVFPDEGRILVRAFSTTSAPTRSSARSFRAGTPVSLTC